jgi:hypothetical protein
VSESDVKTPVGIHTITPHIVVSDAAAAAAWYVQVLDGAMFRGGRSSKRSQRR